MILYTDIPYEGCVGHGLYRVEKEFIPKSKTLEELLQGGYITRLPYWDCAMGDSIGFEQVIDRIHFDDQ
jgi:hypothetical protein